MNFPTNITDFISAVRSKDLCPKGIVGLRFERNMFPRQYRDLITFYKDGKILFERYCFGEAACCIQHLWADGIGEDGSLAFIPTGEHYKSIENAPPRLTGVSQEGLVFSHTKDIWLPLEELKKDKKNGYGVFSLFRKK